MRNRKRMWIDVDEVLANFQGAVFSSLKRLFGREVTPDQHPGDAWDAFILFSEEERKTVYEDCKKPGFCRNLDIVPGSQQAVNNLRKEVDLFAVTTHFPSVTWVFERDEWLREHFGFKREEIVHTGSKFLIDADICLDDNPKHVTSWQGAHPDGLAMLWAIPNTRNLPLEKYRVSSWDNVLERVHDFHLKPSVYDMLDEREWAFEDPDIGVGGNYCQECGAAGRGSRRPTHKSKCRLHEILTRYRSQQ